MRTTCRVRRRLCVVDDVIESSPKRSFLLSRPYEIGCLLATVNGRQPLSRLAYPQITYDFAQVTQFLRQQYIYIDSAAMSPLIYPLRFNVLKNIAAK